MLLLHIGISAEADHFHPVQERSGDSICRVGCAYEEDL
jgi:hypothetical protein